MKCIFCFQEKLSSDEHVIPESIGGSFHIKEVCCECNSELSRLVDNPFAACPLIQAVRFHHSIGGKRDNVPFPFGKVGTTDTGQKISLDKNFIPHVKRDLQITELPNGGLQVTFSADVSDKDKLEQMIGKPLRKAFVAKFPSWSSEKLNGEISKIIEHARAQTPVLEHKPIKQQLKIGLDDLSFEFMKIAYEMWFRLFGYPWVENSAIAKNLRTAILNHDPSLIHAKSFCLKIPLPVSDPLKNHLILQFKGYCFIRLFDFSYIVECEEREKQFMLNEEDSCITIQNFHTGILTEEKLSDFLAKNLPTI